MPDIENGRDDWPAGFRLLSAAGFALAAWGIWTLVSGLVGFIGPASGTGAVAIFARLAFVPALVVALGLLRRGPAAAARTAAMGVALAALVLAAVAAATFSATTMTEILLFLLTAGCLAGCLRWRPKG